MRKSAEGPYLSTAQVAKLFDVSPRMVASWIRAGDLDAINVASRDSSRPRYKISRAAINKFKRLRSAAFQTSTPQRKSTRKKKKSRRKKRAAKKNNTLCKFSIAVDKNILNAVPWILFALLVLLMLEVDFSTGDLSPQQNQITGLSDLIKHVLLVLGQALIDQTTIQIKLK